MTIAFIKKNSSPCTGGIHAPAAHPCGATCPPTILQKGPPHFLKSARSPRIGLAVWQIAIVEQRGSIVLAALNAFPTLILTFNRHYLQNMVSDL